MRIKATVIIEYEVDGEYSPDYEGILTELVCDSVSSESLVLDEEICILSPHSIEVVSLEIGGGRDE